MSCKVNWKNNSPRRARPGFRQVLRRPLSSSPDREPSRLAAAPPAPGRSGSLSTRASFHALRAGTARGPIQSFSQPWVLRVLLFPLTAVLLNPASLSACGPNFPNNLLDGGDAAVLVAPVADFIGELQRMKLVESKFQAV